jgi:hypothetical protein
MAKYKLTDKHRAQLKPWADKWIANALSTKPMDDEDRAKMREAIAGLYAAANLAAPRVIFCPSPIVGAIASTTASAIWWLRENPKEQVKLFGRVYSEAELMSALVMANVRAVLAAKGVVLSPVRGYAATYAATDAATHDATYAATRDATADATDAATADATRDATAVATEAATDAATVAATAVATAVATDAATYDATYAATRDATADATDAATADATRDATAVATEAATDAATVAATAVATAVATDAATYDATAVATEAATYDATAVATEAATDAATVAATYDATAVATRDATYDATAVATDAATADATRDATAVATYVATRDATAVATDAATHDATYAATRAATYATTRAATRAATEAATRAATEAATYDATYAATHDATYAATRAATEVATNAATEVATNATNQPLVAFLLGCTNRWYSLVNGGNMWSGWAAFISFFDRVVGLKLKEYEKWHHYEVAAIHGGYRFMHAKFCIVADRPRVLTKDERNRPHAERGPHLAWSDGFERYAWHGVMVPKEWITSPGALDAKTALTWPNIEQRRAAAEILGWSKILSEVPCRVLDKDPDPMIGELLEVDLPDSPKAKFLRVRCGTGREFCLPMPPEVKTALVGNAWSFGVENIGDVKRFKNYVVRT